MVALSSVLVNLGPLFDGGTRKFMCNEARGAGLKRLFCSILGSCWVGVGTDPTDGIVMFTEDFAPNITILAAALG